MPIDRTEYQKKYKKNYKAVAKRVTLTFSRDEYEKIEKAAAEEGVKVATLLRARSLGTAPSTPSASPKGVKRADAAKEIIFILRNVANNINQMAFHSNLLRQVLDMNEPLLALARLEDEILSYLKKQTT
jgi:3-methyladenine DNA glycosylase AlkC